VTTEPELRRTIASRRLPSSFEIARTRNRSLDTTRPVLARYDGIRLRDRHDGVVDLEANVR
jgi:hypothetical protein